MNSTTVSTDSVLIGSTTCNAMVKQIIVTENLSDISLMRLQKNTGVFPTDDSLLKMLYLAMIYIAKKWAGKCREWGQIHS